MRLNYSKDWQTKKFYKIIVLKTKRLLADVSFNVESVVGVVVLDLEVDVGVAQYLRGEYSLLLGEKLLLLLL